MQETARSALGEWESFYLIIGGAAAALTGLQFVVITLVTESRSRTTSTGGIDAFATPTIVHFCGALFLSVVMSSPWPRLGEPAIVIGAAGAAGLIYTAIVVRRATRQTAYTMVGEDWLWHVTLPFLAYGALLGAGLILTGPTLIAEFVVAASSLLLLYIGIHNAWDTSTFMVAQRLDQEREGVPAPPPLAPAPPPPPPPPPPSPAAPATPRPAATTGDGGR